MHSRHVKLGEAGVRAQSPAAEDGELSKSAKGQGVLLASSFVRIVHLLWRVVVSVTDHPDEAATDVCELLMFANVCMNVICAALSGPLVLQSNIAVGIRDQSNGHKYN